jgi:hypothetical protein
VRVVPEARAGAEELVRLLRETHMGAALAEALLMSAQAALLDGDGPAAERAADEARLAFVAQERTGWAAVAGYVAMRARWTRGSLGAEELAQVRALAHELDTAGWAVPALDARLTAARVALERGDVAEARRDLEVAARARRTGPVDLRARAWHAEALLRLASGDRAGAERALRAGVRVLDEHRDSLGATELRVHAAARAEDLAGLGLRLALDGGRAHRVLSWAERWRAGALRARPARPPEDAELGEALSELRRVASELEAAALAGDATRVLEQRQASLERSIRDRARHGRDPGASLPWEPPAVEDVRARLGDAALVEYVSSAGQLFAVTVNHRRARLFPLVPLADAAGEIESLRFSYTRLVRGHGSRQSMEAFSTTSEYATGQLDQWLLAPLRREIGDAPLIVAPTGALHRIPWAGLPSCRGRTVSVTPSAAMWLAAAGGRPAEGGRVVLAAGPDVPNAEAEVGDLYDMYPDADVLTGARATSNAVARAVDGADVAHVVAHGTFRSDNPLFSALQLADGDLTVYDLELLDTAPRLLVLSACESGVTDVRTGDELMGFAAALFALGSRTLVASVVPVPDDATRPLMTAFHRRLAAGETPATALARAQASVSDDLGVSPAATAGFVCLGA